MANKTMPKDHPVAWGSPLWPHLELIRSMRRQRKKWADIADHLEADHGVKVTFRTVRNFFKRATDPNKKRPLGFDSQPATQAAQAQTVPPAPPQTQPSGQDAYEKGIDERSKRPQPKLIPFND